MPDSIIITFVDEVRRVSRNIDDYLASQLYLTDVEDPDHATDEVIFNLVMNMVVDELKQMGLSVEQGSIYTDVVTINIIKALRTVFDTRVFATTIRDSETMAESILQILQGMDEDRYDILPEKIITLIHTELPLSAAWEFLNINADAIEGTYLFHDHIKRLAENCIEETATDLDGDIIIAYTEAILNHQAAVARSVNLLIMQFPLDDVDITFLKNQEKDYDIDLIHRVPPADMPKYLDEVDPHPAHTPAEESHEVVLHKQINPHHIEAFVANNMITTLNEINSNSIKYLIAIAADSYRPSWPTQKNISHLMESVKTVGLHEDSLAILHKCINLLTQQVTA